MTARSTRLVGLAATGTLVAGLLAAPPAIAASGDESSSDPVFARISAGDLPSGSAGERSVAARVSKSSNEQILQSFTGRVNVGADGIDVAAGPKHVIQLGATGATTFVKSTGKKVKQQNLNGFFKIDVAVDLSDPTIAYDPVGKRWVAVTVTDDGGDVGLAVRVSKGTDPTKKWFSSVRYADADSGDSNPDVIESMPRLGISSDKLAITAVSDDPGDASVANRIMFLPKSAVYKNQSPDAWVADVNNTYDGQAPAVNASKQPNAFIAVPDTSDITVTTYTGAATTKAPKFSKSVMYPATAMAAPPLVDQGSGDDLDLGDLTFNGVAWRSGKLYAAATSDCAGEACIRVFGVNTGNGVTLVSDKTLKTTGQAWFTPSLAIDGAGNVHLAATNVGKVGIDGPSFAVFARKASNGKWTSARFVANAVDRYAGPGNPTPWVGGTAAAPDPSSSWDVWVTGGVGATGGGTTSKVARVSLAKNIATIKASSTKVAKGKKVTFTAKLMRPGGDTLKGLPVALQKKAGSKWSTVGSKKTSAKGVAKWTLKIKKAASYRTYGKAVKQVDGAGKVFDKVYSKPVKISLK